MLLSIISGLKRMFSGLSLKSACAVNIKNMGYRPEIDGLRAVAVLSVVLNHLGVNGFGGGFVGVDVFFTISGYLITALLIKEMRDVGKINFYDFYLRRIRRILPALLCSALLTFVAAFFILTPQRFGAFGGSMLHALYSVSNIFFYHESGYFDSGAILKPLLHTWSLGVEEQFYLVWPIFIMIIGVSFRRLAIAAILLGGSSLYFSVMVTENDAAAAFFLMPFRGVEFCLGAMVVLLEAWRKPGRVWVNDGLLAAGLLSIAFAVIFYDKATKFPGVAAVLPCLGAALCIYAGATARLRVLLANRIAVGVGLISYSLYLVHWPIIVLYVYSFDVTEFSSSEIFLISLMAMILSAAIYFCIEKRFRRKQSSNRDFMIGLACTMFALTYAGASVWATDGWKWRPGFSEALSVKAIEDGKKKRFTAINVQCAKKGWAQCQDIVPGKVNAFVIGDSHAPDAHNGFAKLYPDHNFVVSTLGGCPPYQDIARLMRTPIPEMQKCLEINVKRHDPEYLRQFDYIVINVLYAWYTGEHMAEYLEYLGRLGIKKVVVFGGYLTLSKDLPEIINQGGYSTRSIEKYVQNKPSEDAVRKKAAEFNYLFISKMDAFCKDGRCEFFDEARIPFTYDKDHLSYEYGVKMVMSKSTQVSAYLGAR